MSVQEPPTAPAPHWLADRAPGDNIILPQGTLPQHTDVTGQQQAVRSSPLTGCAQSAGVEELVLHLLSLEEITSLPQEAEQKAKNSFPGVGEGKF